MGSGRLISDEAFQAEWGLGGSQVRPARLNGVCEVNGMDGS